MMRNILDGRLIGLHFGGKKQFYLKLFLFCVVHPVSYLHSHVKAREFLTLQITIKVTHFDYQNDKSRQWL